MIAYLFFFILGLLPLIEGEWVGIGRFLFLASCLPLSIYLFRRLGKNRIFSTKIFIIFLGFAFLSTVLSPVASRSLSTLVLYFAYFIYFLTAGILAKERRDLFKGLLTIDILLPSLFLCLLTFYFLIFKEKFPFSSMNLIFANFGHNHVVDFLIFSFPLALFLFHKQKAWVKRLLFLFLNLIYLAAFVFSFSRGGILMAILIVVSMEFILIKQKSDGDNVKKTSLYNLGLIFLLSVVLVVSIIGFYYFNRGKGGMESKSIIFAKVFREIPFKTRIGYWRQSWRAFAERPLLGWGLDNFRYASVRFQKVPLSWSWYTHNHFLQMFVELGLLGGVSFLILVIFVLKNAVFLKDANGEIVPFKVGIIASFIHSFFDYDWQFISVFLIFWVIAGFLVGRRAYNNRRSQSGENNFLVNGIFMKPVILLVGVMLLIVGFLELGGDLFLYLGGDAEVKKEYARAESYYERSFKLWPFKLEKYRAVADFYRKEGQKNRALVFLEKAATLEPINDKNYELIGDWYWEEKDYPKAQEYYQKATVFNPLESLDIYLRLIDMWVEKKGESLEEVVGFLMEIEKIKGNKCILKCLGVPNEKKILELLFSLIKRNDFSQLSAPRQARIYYWLAVLTTDQKDWDKDIDFLKKALDLDSREEYRNFLGDLLLIKEMNVKISNKEYLEAERLAKDFEAKIGPSPVFHERWYLEEPIYSLGMMRMFENRLKEAELYFKRALEINPWDDRPYLRLADIYGKDGNRDKAIEILKECLAYNSWSKDCRNFQPASF